MTSIYEVTLTNNHLITESVDNYNEWNWGLH